jgi:hypothetical protein
MSEYVLKQKGTGTGDDETLARNAFNVGDIIYGYCRGYFGRSSFGDKKIISIEGNHLCCIESSTYGPVHHGCVVKSWVELLKSSNASLAEQEADEADNEAWKAK